MINYYSRIFSNFRRASSGIETNNTWLRRDEISIKLQLQDFLPSSPNAKIEINTKKVSKLWFIQIHKCLVRHFHKCTSSLLLWLSDWPHLPQWLCTSFHCLCSKTGRILRTRMHISFRGFVCVRVCYETHSLQSFETSGILYGRLQTVQTLCAEGGNTW